VVLIPVEPLKSKEVKTPVVFKPEQTHPISYTISLWDSHVEYFLK
jgi:hypothetical protein